jgi:hypothetical protein
MIHRSRDVPIQRHGRKWYQLTRIESLVIVAIIAVLVTLLISPAQWALSGEIETRIRILVFDARSAKPIPRAKCTVIRGSPWLSDEFFENFQNLMSGIDIEKRKNDAPVEQLNEAMT